MTEEEKALSLKTRTQFKTILNKYLILPKKELRAMARKADIPALDAMLIKSLIKTFESGDQTQINWFLNHVLGKEKESTNINLTGSMENTNTSKVDPSNLTKEQLLLLKEIAEANESSKS